MIGLSFLNQLECEFSAHSAPSRCGSDVSVIRRVRCSLEPKKLLFLVLPTKWHAAQNLFEC